MSRLLQIASLLAASYFLVAAAQAEGARGFGRGPGFPPPHAGRRPYPVPVPVPVPIPDGGYYGGAPAAPPPPPRRQGESINGQWYY